MWSKCGQGEFWLFVWTIQNDHSSTGNIVQNLTYWIFGFSSAFLFSRTGLFSAAAGPRRRRFVSLKDRPFERLTQETKTPKSTRSLICFNILQLVVSISTLSQSRCDIKTFKTLLVNLSFKKSSFLWQTRLNDFSLYLPGTNSVYCETVQQCHSYLKNLLKKVKSSLKGTNWYTELHYRCSDEKRPPHVCVKTENSRLQKVLRSNNLFLVVLTFWSLK